MTSPCRPAGKLLLDRRQHRLHAGDHRQQAGRRHRLDADIDALLAVVFDAGFVIVRAERDVGDIAQPDDAAIDLLDHQVAELLHRMQVGRGGQIELHHLALGVADAGDHVIGAERRRSRPSRSAHRRPVSPDPATPAGRSSARPAVPPSARRAPPAAAAARCESGSR